MISEVLRDHLRIGSQPARAPHDIMPPYDYSWIKECSYVLRLALFISLEEIYNFNEINK